MENFQDKSLQILMEGEEQSLIMSWVGQSDSRDPSAVLNPFLNRSLEEYQGQELTLNDEETPSAIPPQDRRRELRAAAITVALARAKAAGSMASDLHTHDLEPTPWGSYYRQRQLRPGGRGRIA